jgi:protein-S-isoprenylcysteine O-methyltransferase Ste14
MNDVLDFVPIWTLILGVGIFFYVLLDGFDLGVGMLYGLAPDTERRNIIMNSIAPVWDGNETWLILGGVGLMAAFPLAFAIIIPALYFPILVMLLALGLRIWSMRVLGAYFSRTLRVADAQVIVMQGPYRVLRHPGYTGTILLWIGSGLALTNWLATAVVAILMLAVYSYRIRMEEAMLLTTFGEGYRQYRRHTWKLLPFLY